MMQFEPGSALRMARSIPPGIARSDREEFPAERLADFARLPASDIRAAAHNTRAVEHQFRLTLRRGLAAERALRDVLADIDLELFSCDHAWRDVFARLTALPDGLDPARRAAVEGYLRYLSSRARGLLWLANRQASGGNAHLDS